MRIGLLRHFPVEEGFPTGWRTSAELQAWLERYDLAATSVGTFDLGELPWQRCLASDSTRAVITARAVFPGEIEFTELLREARIASFQTGALRLPVGVWRWVLRLCWLTGHRSQRACRDEFRQRMLAVADRLCASREDTLVVSHAGMMTYLSEELRRRGFSGPRLRVPRHATVYVYERADNNSSAHSSS